MAFLGGLLAKKFVFGSISTFLYGGGGGSVAYGVAGLGTEIDSLSDTEVEVDETVTPVRKALRLKRAVGTSDRISMRNKPSDTTIDKATNLPNGFVNSQMYQMESSMNFDRNDQNYYCSKVILEDRVAGVDENDRQADLNVAPQGGKRTGAYYGCVNVLGHKDYYDGGKGKGSGKFQYTLVTCDYTVILVNTVDADNGKLTIDGVSYILRRVFEKDGSNKHTGNVTGGKPQPKQELTKDNRNKLLVAPGGALFNKRNDGGFDFSSEKVCKEGECFGDSLRTEYSNRIGKAAYKKADTREETKGKIGGAYEGGANFNELTATGGMFEGLKTGVQAQMRGFYGLDVNNYGIETADKK